MSNGNLGPVHPIVTQRSGRQYFFYIKHHDPNNVAAAQWDPELSHDEEFAVFDLADLHDLANSKGDLFGLHRDAAEKVRTLGTRGEQVAEFPFTTSGNAWHGYPLYPISTGAGSKRKSPCPTEALDKMEEAGLLKRSQKNRLKGGKPI